MPTATKVIQMKTEIQDSDAFQMAAINMIMLCAGLPGAGLYDVRHKMQHTKQMFAKMPTSKKWWACVIVSALDESHLGGSGGITARDILKKVTPQRQRPIIMHFGSSLSCKQFTVGKFVDNFHLC